MWMVMTSLDTWNLSLGLTFTGGRSVTRIWPQRNHKWMNKQRTWESTFFINQPLWVPRKSVYVLEKEVPTPGNRGPRAKMNERRWKQIKRQKKAKGNLYYKKLLVFLGSVPICISFNNEWAFLLLYTWQQLVFLVLCVMVSHRGFNFHFSSDKWCWTFFIYLFAFCVSFLMRCLQLSVDFVILDVYLYLGPWCIFWLKM